MILSQGVNDMSAAIVNKFMRMMGIGENDEDNEYVMTLKYKLAK